MFIKNSILILLLFVANVAYSQITTKVIDINWKNTVKNHINGELSQEINICEPCVNNSTKNYLPEIRVKLSEQFEPSELFINSISSSSSTKILNANSTKESFKIEKQIILGQANYYLIKDAFFVENGISKRINSINIQYKLTSPKSILGTATANISESVLNNGTWIKIGVTAEGIYKIDKKLITDAGFSANVNPKNIAVYGYGGSMISQKNGKNRIDDLPEIPIQAIGEADGTLDNNDYFLFYSKGPHTWKLDSTGYFQHTYNIYSDTVYYFLTVKNTSGLRIKSETPITAAATYTTNSFLDRQFYEVDKYNLNRSGKLWLGEILDVTTTQSIPFNFNEIIPNTDIVFRSAWAAKSHAVNPIFNLNVAGFGTPLTGIISLIPSGSYAPLAAYGLAYAKVNSNTTSTINCSLEFLKNGDPGAQGWLDYISINARRKLKLYNSVQLFRDSKGISNGVITQFEIENNGATLQVWNVSNEQNPSILPTSSSGNNITFKAKTDSINEFAVFNGNSFGTPIISERIQNQNLHSYRNIEYVILSHPNFVSEAERLKNHYEQTQNLKVAVVTPQQIYNEFSSGRQDITAIRDFLKMIYDRSQTSTTKLRYFLLFGDGSFDFKNRIQNNTNMVPVYQSDESLSPVGSYCTDSYFAFLDDNEGEFSENVNEGMDIAIGRLPINNSTQAAMLVDKSINYGTNNSPADWRNYVMFVADDGDWLEHVRQAEVLTDTIKKKFSSGIIEKIYVDAYPRVPTAGGDRTPGANAAINQRMNYGALLVNYIGHGGGNGWADERILTASDINSWQNKGRLPVFLTATCEFSRFDDPGKTAAGELVLNNPNGGAIALFTTVRVTYSWPNFSLSHTLYSNHFFKENRIQRLGDIILGALNEYGISDYNTRCFNLLGDPAIKLSIPSNGMKITSINGNTTNSTAIPDTLKALGKALIEGHLTDPQGNILSNFNGIAYQTVLDKTKVLKTLGQNGNDGFNYANQSNVIFKGKSSVVNGKFKFEFIVPKDIAYNYDFGKIVVFANSNSGDIAGGDFTNVIIGGTQENFASDTKGPNIKIYLNDEKFANGGVTDPNPILIAKFSDSSGINTVGNGIGHDLNAVIDNLEFSPIVLNNYYESELDNFREGKVNYKISKLTDGKHTLKVKAWDVYNNSNEAEIEFIVAESANTALKNLLNYPNPFTTNTTFMFDHNLTGHTMDVQIQIFTVAGKILKTLQTNYYAEGNHFDQLKWEGLDDYGQRIGKGVYIYKVRIKTTDGKYTEAVQKLVLLR